MENVAEIIAQFAEYLTVIISYIKEFLDKFSKKDEKAEDAAE